MHCQSFSSSDFWLSIPYVFCKASLIDLSLSWSPFGAFSYILFQKERTKFRSTLYYWGESWIMQFFNRSSLSDCDVSLSSSKLLSKLMLLIACWYYEELAEGFRNLGIPQSLTFPVSIWLYGIKPKSKHRRFISLTVSLMTICSINSLLHFPWSIEKERRIDIFWELRNMFLWLIL